MKKSLLILSLFVSTTVYSSDFCQRTQEDIRGLLHDKSSRIAFKNDGGLFNQGVCWWHNRLQRASAYLVIFEPSAPRPSTSEAWKLLTDLRSMNQTVIIPGYKDFESFSLDYKHEVQAILNGWQKRDGFYNFEWIRGISGKSSLPSGQMLERMKIIYTHFKKSPTPLWIMAQIKGITSHSMLILEMTETTVGYEMKVIDSNYPQETVSIVYQNGDTSLEGHKGKYTFVPYSGFQKDFVKINNALKTRCGDKAIQLPVKDIPQGEVEL